MVSIKKIFKKDMVYILIASTLFMLSNFVLNIVSINNDDFFFLNIGRYILKNLSFPTVDHFTLLGQYHQLSMTNSSWLYSIFLQFGYSLTGSWLFLQLSTILASFIISLLLGLIVKTKTKSKTFPAVIISLWGIMSTLNLSFFLQIRPQTFAIIFLLLIIYFFETKKNIWFVPPFMLIAMNIHVGLWPIFILVVAFYTWKNKQYKIFGLSALTTLLTPNNIQGILSPFKFMKYKGLYQGIVKEWQPFWSLISGITDLANIFPIIILLLIAIFIIYLVFSKQISLWEIICFSSLFILITTGSRYAIFVFVILVPWLSTYILDTTKKAFGKLYKYQYSITFFILIIFIINIIIFIPSMFSKIDQKQMYISNKLVPQEMINYMVQNNITACINNDYGVGGQLNYYGISAPFDNRTEIYIPTANKDGHNYWLDYVAILKDPSKMVTMAKKYNVKYLLIIVNKNDDISDFLNKNHLQIIKKSDGYTLLKILH